MQQVGDAGVKGASRLDRRRQKTIDEIKRRSREQLALNGHGGLSLRAVAREMKLSSAAIYRYFPNQHDLITALCVDAYSSLADAAEQARHQNGRGAERAQLRSVLTAIRQWAQANPAEFTLIFGTPVPGYSAPPETTGPASSRLLTAIVEPYSIALTHGDVQLTPTTVRTADNSAGGEAENHVDERLALPPDAVMRATNATVSLLGFVAFETWGSFNRDIGDPDERFQLHLDAILSGMGFADP